MRQSPGCVTAKKGRGLLSVLAHSTVYDLLINPLPDFLGLRGQAKTGLPVVVGIALAQRGVSFRHGTFVRCAERIEHLTLELFLVVVEECADDCRLLMPPYRETDENRVDLVEVHVQRLERGTQRLVEVLLRAARLLVDPVDILRRIGL